MSKSAPAGDGNPSAKTSRDPDSKATSAPELSVVVLNYNGKQWLSRCFESLEKQTIFQQIEVILTDNKSADGSDQFAEQWLSRLQKGRVVQNGANLGYCEANNNGAAAATGKYLLFLNNDTWLEPDCLEKLLAGVEACHADAATPLVLDYDSDNFQSIGGHGIDLFGMAPGLKPVSKTTEIFVACGCSLLISAEMFRRVGGFDPALFIYVDETDLSFRVIIAGGKIVGVPSARLHHRGAAGVNPAGDTKVVEARTTETKRFLANRNGLLLLLKDCQNILLVLLIPQLLLLAVEMVISLVLVRRWSYIRKAYIGAVADCWRLRHHVREWRQRIRGFRQRSDFQMLRYLRLKPNRWEEAIKLIKSGGVKIDPR